MYVGGKNVVKEILKNNSKIIKAYIWDRFDDINIVSELEKRNISIKTLNKQQLDNLENINHQGIILDIPDYEYINLEDLLKLNSDFIVMLDHIEDPHNFGAIIRTCESAGVEVIIIPNDRTVEVNSTVMKTSSGALSNIKICRVSNLTNAIKVLKSNNYWVVGTTMESNTKYYELKYDFPVVLIIGNEGHGISKLVLESCDYIVNIPMKGKVNSLNASVAAGILIYEIVKKKE